MATPSIAFGDRRLPPRFWRKVAIDSTTGCWEWSGSRTRYGYGRYCLGSGTARAHRHLFKTLVGELDGSESVRHTCDNPPCVNPEHLLRGSHDENMQDAVDRGRTPWGERSGRAVLTEASLRQARADRAAGAAVKDLASTHGIHASTMSRALRGKSWARVTAQVGVLMLVVAGGVILDLSVPAQASNAPYFTVSSTEIVACYTADPGTLDANVKFEDGTRLNFHPWPYTLTAGCYTFTLPTGHGLPTWVQVHGFNCHIGEDNTGREQNCSWLPTTTPTEEPTWTPEPTETPSDPEPPSETQTPPSPEPSEPPTTPTTPGPEPTTPTSSPTTPTTQPSQPSEQPSEPGLTPQPEPSTPPDPTDTPATPTPIQPEETPWPTTRPAPPVAATPETTTTGGTSDSRPTADEPSSTSGPASPPSPSLAVTGSNDPLVGVVAGLFLVILGLNLAIKNYRRKQ